MSVNSPLTNNINLVVKPTKIKWKIHAFLRQSVVDPSFIVTPESKNKTLLWFDRINFDYYEKFFRKMFFCLSFFCQVFKKGKIHTKLKLASKFTLSLFNYGLVMYFMNFMSFACIFTFFVLRRRKIFPVTLGSFMDPEPGFGPWKTWMLKILNP